MKTVYQSMKKALRRWGQRIYADQRGVLSFEWILLITLVVIGIVGGLSAVRDAIIDELGDMAGAAVAIDQSYTVTACTYPEPPSNPCLAVSAKSFQFTDSVPQCNGQSVPVRERPTEPVVDQGAVGNPCE